MPGLGHDTGQHAQQIGHLIGAGVVGAHQRVRRVQRAVQDAGLGVLRRHLQAGVVHPHAGGEHHVRIVVGYLLQYLLRVHLRVHILVAADIHLVREDLGQRIAPLVMRTHPCADLGVVLVEEHHPQLTGLLAGAEDIQLGQQRLCGALGRFQRKLHAMGLGEHLHLVPQLFQVLPYLRRGGVVGVGVAVHRQVHQQRITGGQPQGSAAQGFELLVEHGVEGGKVQPVILRPCLAAGLAHQRLQLAVAAQLGEMHIVHLGQLIEIQELVVDLIFQILGAGGDEPGDRARDLDGAVILEHRDPLVALLHIEPVHVLKGDDGSMDALFQVRVAQVRPLGSKLGIRLQQGHKVIRKGSVPSAGLGAHKAVRRDLHQPQRLLRHDIHTLEHIVQNSQIGRLAAGYAGTIGALPCAQCTFIIFQHKNSFFCKRSAVPQSPCRTGTPPVYHKNRNKAVF